MEMPFYILMMKTFHAHQNAIRPFLTDLGIKPGQPKLLGYLVHKKDCMQKDLAQFYNVEPATISKMLSELEEQGFITRQPVEGNKRAASVSITEKGRAVNDQIRQAQQQVEAAALQGFTQEERACYTLFLKKMYQNLTGAAIS